jgi:hypothetical protein
MKKKYSKHFHTSPPGFVHNFVAIKSLIFKKIAPTGAKQHFKLNVIGNNARDECRFF